MKTHIIFILVIIAIVSCKGIGVKPDFLIDNQSAYTEPLINEFMAVNSHVPFKNPIFMETQVFGVKEYPDWIEIFNPTDKILKLEGWYLTDNDNNLTKWEFPENIKIESYGYLIIFASNKNKADFPENYPFVDDLGFLHTNFALSGDGEYLAIVKPDGATIVQEYDFPEQRGLISYGIDKNGETGYLIEPTPGSLNSSHYEEFVSDTKFNMDRGYYDSPFELIISTQTKDADIYYTLDSSTPSETNGIKYSGPIKIDRTTVLKAVAYKDSMLPTDVDTQTYIFIDDILTQERGSYPRNWDRNIPGDYELDSEILSQNNDSEINDSFFSLPVVSVSTDQNNLFGYDDGIYVHSDQGEFSGIEWERECSFEFFDPKEDNKNMQVNCGIRISGDSSSILTNNRKLSFRLLFKGGYGPSRIDFKLFENESPGFEPVKTFNHLMLRSCFNDSWVDRSDAGSALYLRNRFLNETFLSMGQINPHGRFVHLFLNGFYWGIYELHERPNSDFQSEYFGFESSMYDTLNNGKEPAMDGDYSVWNNIISISEQENGFFRLLGINPDFTNNPLEEALLNMENLIDYIICSYYFADEDWQWFSGRLKEENSTGFRFFIWDAEQGLNNSEDHAIQETAPLQIFHNLFNNNEDFRLLTADRIYRHLYNDGALSNSSSSKRFERIAGEIEKAMLLESARWGDSTGDVLFTKGDWENEKKRLINSYFSKEPGINRTYYIQNLFKNTGLYPDIPVPEFLINNSLMHGGDLSSDDNLLAISNNNSGDIYYTTDGTDPRQPGGEINNSNVYSKPILLDKTTLIKSRTFKNGSWSALNEAVFTVGLIKESLRITEIMYHPEQSSTGDYNRDDFEFIEFKNISRNRPINLSMIHFTEGIDYTFPSYELLPGEYAVLVKNKDAYLSRYPGSDITKILGPYSGSLNNAGETLVLNDGNNKVIFTLSYDDKWFSITDGTGFSLNAAEPSNLNISELGIKETWQVSSVPGGTPLKDDTGTPFVPDSVIINEVLAHSHDNAPDWLELYNTTDNPVDISGWYLSDEDHPDLKKYRIAEGTVIPPKSYFVFTEDDNFRNENDPGCLIPFSLNDDGETIFLVPVINNQIINDFITEKIGASETGISWGIHFKSTGKTDFVPLKMNTPGTINSEPKTGPIVINEIMYNPAGDGAAEYVELLNISREPVTLYNDKINLFWRFTDGGGLDFDISNSGKTVTIKPGECILLVRNKSVFNLEYNTGSNVQIFEWGTDGKLSNKGEEIILFMPGEIDNDKTAPSYILIDLVNYNDKNLWPTEADGDGYSLNRINPEKYGNDPDNWKASRPTPGVK